jgi:NAD(P)-dependent dehydrogenase (short-subunit alcohol dehydrogenase family)
LPSAKKFTCERYRICPVETDFLRDRMNLSEAQINALKEQERRTIPLGQRGEPADVAHWTLHLADPEADWITGQVVAVDSGLAVTQHAARS